MSNNEIKSKCEEMYVQIEQAEDTLKELRALCNHEKKREGLYSWRIGSIQLADICEYCGTPINFK